MVRTPAIALVLIALSTTAVTAQEIDNTTEWSADALRVYDTGFAGKLIKSPGGGVCLFDVDLVENDAPGAGNSERGDHDDAVWGDVRARKVLAIDDPRAKRVWLYVFPQRNPAHPLTFTVNGNEGVIDNTPTKGWETVRFAEFPAEWLKEGKNVIDLFCPEASTEDEGWNLQIARADEYPDGGGDPERVGETSFRSDNGGRSWKESPFGPEGDTRAEYCVRISLERHVPRGWLETPVIDLWRGDADDPVARQRMIKSLRVRAESDVPEGTHLTCKIRGGTHPSPFSGEWGPWRTIGEGGGIDETVEGAAFNRRYMQVRLDLGTENPLESPVVRRIDIEAGFKESFPVPRHRNIIVTAIDNPPVEYSSLDWEWEPYGRPELEQLALQENLETVVAGSRTQFEAQMRLLDYAKKRWRWTSPAVEYPAWDALSIVERVNKAGGGGMCIQQNLFFIGLCQAFGWQGRLLGVDGHEVCEVWNDEYGKWIYFDAFFPNHVLCDPESGEPLSMLELHDRYLDYFYPDRAMDWKTDYRLGLAEIREREDKPPVVRSSLTFHDHERNACTGFLESRILRLIPRTNFFEKPLPRPLAHFGGGYFWDGYVSWYDPRTPPRGQYADHTDRPRDLWPDLNTVHITMSQGYGNDRLFLEFETCTPGFERFEVRTDGGEWTPAGDRWTWLLVPGGNRVEVRAVNSAGVGGRPSSVTVNHVVMPLNEWTIE